MWGGSRCSAWQQKCTQSVCPYVWLVACGCTRVAAVHQLCRVFSEGTIICLFVTPFFLKLEEHFRILTVIYKGFLIAGSTVVPLRRSGSVRGHDPASFLDLPGRERLIPGMVKVVDSLVGPDTQLVSGSIAGRASRFQSFDGSWGWKWRCTGVVCLPQVVNNNKAEMKKSCTDFCAHTKCTGNIFSMRHSVLYFTRF